MNWNLALLMLPIVALAACDEDSEASSGQQQWLCGREYENHAWGYQRKGTVLDSQGQVWKYFVTPAQASTPWSPKDRNKLSAAELGGRYAGARLNGKTVSKADIAKFWPLVAEVAKSPANEPTPHGADMGEITDYCYAYDEAAGTYAEILIDQKGDWNREHPSAAAKQLLAWLNPLLALEPN